MDGTRFDDLTRALALPRTRRAFLGAVLAGTAGALGSRVGPAAAAPKPKPCLPEGKKSQDPGRCCSKTTADGRCCGVEGGSCAVTGCCDPVSVTPICHDGACVICLLEGTPSEDPDVCCSTTTAGGLCCGEVNGSCAVSGCCSGNTFCVGGSCVGCLPEGYPSANAIDCCSFTLGDGVCCGSFGGSCAQSGCCDSAAYLCDNGTCVPCLPEGAPSTDPAKCCGKTVSGGVCRAEGCLPDGAAATDASLCCSLLVANGVCAPCYPDGWNSPSPLDCCSQTTSDDGFTCCGEAGETCAESGCCATGLDCCNGSCSCETPCVANGATCTADAECCGGACCNSVCVDTQTDRSHCGGCGTNCGSGPTLACQGGVCSYQCGDIFCPFGVPCSMAGGAPVPAACCPYGPPGNLYPYQCGDGVCCWAATPSYICNNFHSPCSPP